MNREELDCALWQLSRPDGDKTPADPGVTPWGTAMSRILWGMVLTTLSFQLLYLHYILPSVGVILLVLGFRTLRRANGWLRWGWIVATARAAWKFATFVWLALGPLPGWLTGWAATVLGLVEALCLWRGLCAIRAKAGQEPTAPAGGWLLAWELALVLLGLLRVGGWLVGIPILVSYALILRSLSKLSHSIDEAGYAVEAAPVRVSAPVVLWGYLGALAAAVALCLLLGGRYPMDWAPKEDNRDTVAEAHLRQLGMPEDLIADLAPEDLALLADATALHVGEVTPGNMGDYGASGGEDPLELCTVVAELPGETGRRWIVLHHFRWKSGPAYRGTDCLATSFKEYNGAPIFRDETLAPRGRVLCNRGGMAWAAPYHEVGEERYTYATWFSAEDRRDTVADFSSLRGGTDLRGYLLYGVTWGGGEEPTPEDVVAFFVYYHHQFRPDFPVMDARTFLKKFGGNSGVPYHMGADIMYYPLQGIANGS